MANVGSQLPEYMGAWADQPYLRGDLVSRSGALYQAVTDTAAQPGATSATPGKGNPASWVNVTSLVLDFTGSVDPTAGSGIPSAISSTYHYAGTGLYIKSDTAATDWTAAGAGGDGGGSTPGAVVTVDCGVITALDLVTNGETELVPVATGRLIRAVHFGLDGWEDPTGNAVSVLIITPATGPDSTFGSYLGQWDTDGTFTDTVGEFIGGGGLRPDGFSGTTAFALSPGPLTAVAVGGAGLITAPSATWQALHAYANADVIFESGHLWQVQDSGGTSGADKPAFDSDPTTDGDFEWTDLNAVFGAAHVYADIVTPEAL